MGSCIKLSGIGLLPATAKCSVRVLSFGRRSGESAIITSICTFRTAMCSLVRVNSRDVRDEELGGQLHGSLNSWVQTDAPCRDASRCVRFLVIPNGGDNEGSIPGCDNREGAEPCKASCSEAREEPQEEDWPDWVVEFEIPDADRAPLGYHLI